MTTQPIDPYEEAEKAEYVPRKFVVFGQMQVEVWHCALVKGVGKVPFDPTQHSPDRKFTAIDLTIYPAEGSTRTEAIKRELIAESREWVQIVRPSLKAVAVDLRGLNDKWVQAELAPSGTYKDKTTGEDKFRTTFKFLAVFPSQEACVEAANRHFYPDDASLPGNTAADAPPWEAPPAAAPATTRTPEDDKARQTAAGFLPAFWKRANGDLDEFAKLIATQPSLAKYFTMQSPEVLKVIEKAA